MAKIKYLENLRLFLLAFALAFVCWVIAKTGDTEEARITVSVAITPLDPRTEVQVQPNSVPVILRYPRDLRSYISSDNFRFEVDTQDLRRSLRLDWESKSQPLGAENFISNLPPRAARRVQLLKAGSQTNAVEVRMRWISRPAVVEPQITGAEDLAQGLQLVTPVRVTPREVWVAAEPDVLDKLERDDGGRIRLKTEPVSIAGMSQSQLKNVPIEVPRGVEIVSPVTQFAELGIEIQEIQTIQRVAGVPIKLEAIASDQLKLQYDDKQTTVIVQGPSRLLRQLTPESFEIRMIRPPQELPDTEVEAQLEARFLQAVPEEVRSRCTIREVEPKTIRVRYTAREPNGD